MYLPDRRVPKGMPQNGGKTGQNVRQGTGKTDRPFLWKGERSMAPGEILSRRERSGEGMGAARFFDDNNRKGGTTHEPASLTH